MAFEMGDHHLGGKFWESVKNVIKQRQTGCQRIEKSGLCAEGHGCGMASDWRKMPFASRRYLRAESAEAQILGSV